MFEIENTLSFNVDKLTVGIEYDYVTRTSKNQGILQTTGFVNKDNVNESGTWSLGLLQMDFFYRRKPWYAGQFVRKISPKIDMPKKSVLFFQTILNQQKPVLLQVLVRDVDKTFREAIIHLPQTPIGEIDYAFMEDFVIELEQAQIAEMREIRDQEIEAYLSITGLDDYTLTNNDKQVLASIDNLDWKEYDIIDVFRVKNTHNILSSEIMTYSGNTPYLCASAENNGVSNYISPDTRFLEHGNCVFIGGKTFVVSYQPDDFVSNDSHNLVLYLKQETPTRLNQLALVTCVQKSLSHKYSWGNSVSKEKIKKDKIMLPSNQFGLPDFAALEKIITAIQKVAVADVVKYANRRLETMRQAVELND